MNINFRIHQTLSYIPKLRQEGECDWWWIRLYNPHITRSFRKLIGLHFIRKSLATSQVPRRDNTLLNIKSILHHPNTVANNETTLKCPTGVIETYSYSINRDRATKWYKLHSRLAYSVAQCLNETFMIKPNDHTRERKSKLYVKYKNNEKNHAAMNNTLAHMYLHNEY